MRDTSPVATSHLPSPRTPALTVFLVFNVLAVVWTWPLAAHLSSRIPNDPGDPLLNTWLLWWNAHAVPFSQAWWDAPFMVPLRGALALSEHLVGISSITTPIQLAGGSPLLAYNTAFILSSSLSAFFAFLLVRRLSGSTLAAAFAGIAYGFAPYRSGQLGHLQVLTSQWLPLALLGLHEYVDGGRRRGLIWFAFAWLIQALSNGYYLLFFPVLLVLWIAWFVDWRRRPGRGAAIALTWVLASLPLVPILWKYHAVQSALGLSRTIGDMEYFSATPSSLLRASPLLAFWPSRESRTGEDYLFPGATVVILVAVAVLVSVRRRPVRRSPTERARLPFYVATAIVMYVMSFGPAPAGPGIAIVWHPYTALALLPGYDGLRAVARFATLATLCLSISAGLALCVLTRGAGRARIAIGALAFAGLFVDCWIRPMPLVGPPGRPLLPAVPSAAVLELPTDEGAINAAAMYRAMYHRRPLVNGYTGYTPPHYAILSLGLRRDDPSIATELARGRPLFILVSDASDRAHDWRRYVEGLPGIEALGTGSGGRIYLLPAQPAARVAPAGSPLPAVVTESAPGRIELDLGGVQTVRAIEFAVRWHYPDLGERIAIEASGDRATWSTVWDEWTGGPVLAAAIASPLLVPVRLALPDVRARYLRIHPAPRWLARELKVMSP